MRMKIYIGRTEKCHPEASTCSTARLCSLHMRQPTLVTKQTMFQNNATCILLGIFPSSQRQDRRRQWQYAFDITIIYYVASMLCACASSTFLACLRASNPN